MQTWKQAEYDAAKLFGGKRRRMRLYKPQGPDVKCDVANIEVKQRKVLPKWLCLALQKCLAADRNRLSLILWCQNGQPINEGLAVMSISQARVLLDAYRSQRLSQASVSMQTANAK